VNTNILILFSILLSDKAYSIMALLKNLKCVRVWHKWRTLFLWVVLV